jgi:hypothetical protein
MPPLIVWPGLLPLARHYSSRKCNNIQWSFFGINVASFGNDCCLIVDSFEKNYREKNLIVAGLVRKAHSCTEPWLGVNRRRKAKG